MAAADGYFLSAADLVQLRWMKLNIEKLRRDSGEAPPILFPPSAVNYRYVALQADLAPASTGGPKSVSARFQNWSSSSTGWTTSSSTSDNLTVWDELGQRRAKNGARALVRLMHHSARWEIDKLQELSKRCTAVLKGALNSTAAGSVDAVVPVDYGQSPVGSSTAAINTVNPRKLAGADNAVCGIVAKSSQWEIEYVVPVAQSVLTSIQISTGDRKFQKKTRSVLSMWTATSESTWTTYHTGSACT